MASCTLILFRYIPRKEILLHICKHYIIIYSQPEELDSMTISFTIQAIYLSQEKEMIKIIKETLFFNLLIVTTFLLMPNSSLLHYYSEIFGNLQRPGSI